MSVKSTWHGAAVSRKLRNAAAEGLLDAAEHILSVSQPLVPVAPVGGGYLRDTGVASVDEGELRAAVSYITGDTREDGRHGGGNLAVVVHEDMDSHHTTGQAKFLEQPFNSEKDEVLRRIAASIRRKT